MLAEYILTGASQSELNTEIRFLTASACVDKKALICLKYPDESADRESERIRSCVLRVLRALRKDGCIQFFVTREGFADETTEAVFLINKYGEYIHTDEKYECVYVKL